MAFGQPAGPPATARQLKELLELVVEAGHTDFRDARGPLDLNQRQAAGRFTREEADELIGRLTAEREGSGGDPDRTDGPDARAGRADPVVARAPADRRQAEWSAKLVKVPDEVLAAELQLRGWVVMEP